MLIETLIFDGIIAAVVGSVPVYFAVALKRQRERRGNGPGLLGAVAALAWVVVTYGSFIEPRMLTVREYEAVMGDGGRSFTVALISDTHIGQYRHGEWLEKVVARVNALGPDVVAIAGDVASTPKGIEELGALGKITSRLGAYAVLGNWDYRAGAVDARRKIESYGVEVLTNESAALDLAGGRVRLAGLDDMRYGRPDLDEALRGAEDADLTVLLVHNPDAAPLAESRDVDLVLAGHTHAGQVRLPGIGPVPELPTRLGRHYDRGFFPIGPTTLFITPGVGESGTRARLFNPPEISLIRITF